MEIKGGFENMTNAKMSISISPEAFEVVQRLRRRPEFRNKSHVCEYCILKVAREVLND